MARNGPCLLTGGSGSDQLRLGVEVLTEWALNTLSLTADILALNRTSIEGGGRSTELRHPDAEHTVTAAEPEAEPVSASQNGSRAFEVCLTFTEELAPGYAVPPRTRSVHDRPTHP